MAESLRAILSFMFELYLVGIFAVTLAIIVIEVQLGFFSDIFEENKPRAVVYVVGLMLLSWVTVFGIIAGNRR